MNLWKTHYLLFQYPINDPILNTEYIEHSWYSSHTNCSCQTSGICRGISDSWAVFEAALHCTVCIFLCSYFWKCESYLSARFFIHSSCTYSHHLEDLKNSVAALWKLIIQSASNADQIHHAMFQRDLSRCYLCARISHHQNSTKYDDGGFYRARYDWKLLGCTG